MALFPNQRPSRPASPTWHYVSLEPGRSWSGYLAGEVVTVHVHVVGARSKPCRAAMTGGQLRCVQCDEEKQQPFYRGYVPLWSVSGVEHLAIVGERYIPMASTLTHLQPARVTKLLSRGCPIRVEAEVKELPALNPTTPKGPQDITAWLLRAWKDEALTRWIMDGGRASDTAVSLAKPADPVPHSTGMVPPVELVESALARRKAARLAADAGLQVQFPALAARIAAGKPGPAKNGKHPPPKKG